MTPPANAQRYKNPHFLGEIIGHEAWLYYRFTLSYRDAQEFLMERGIPVSHEAIRPTHNMRAKTIANVLHA